MPAPMVELTMLAASVRTPMARTSPADGCLHGRCAGRRAQCRSTGNGSSAESAAHFFGSNRSDVPFVQ